MVQSNMISETGSQRDGVIAQENGRVGALDDQCPNPYTE